MIPRTIELKNFLSYGDQTQIVDFNEYNLICLSGKNGHGKSALLDALTWAIWGQARKTSGTVKADEGLLRLGQTKMLVSAEFEFNNQIYRVRREFAKTYGKPYTALDFEIFDQARKNFASLTEKTVKATQDKIESLLGLDYETFINTSFLRQGQANEFSKKNPKERKHILATILGLSKYDILQQQAQEQVRHYQDEKKIQQALIDQSTQDIAQEKELLDQAQKDDQQLAIVNQEYTTLQENIMQTEQKKTILVEHKKHFSTLTQELTNLHHIHEEKNTIFLTTVLQWKQVHKATLHLPNIKALEQEQQHMHEQEKQHLILQQNRLKLQEEQLHIKEKLHNYITTFKNNFEQSLHGKKLELEKNMLLKQQLLQTMAQKQAQLTETQQKKKLLQHEIDTLIIKNQSMHSINESYQKNKKQFDKRHNFYQSLLEKGNWLKNLLQEFEHKKKLVTDTISPSCPLCEQMLTAKRKQFLGAKLITQEHFFTHQFQRISKIITRLKQLLLEQHKLIETLEKESTLCTQQEERIHAQQALIIELSHVQEQHLKELTTIQQQEQEINNQLTTIANALAQGEASLQESIQNDITILSLTQRLEVLEQEKQKLLINETTNIKRHERIQEIETLLKNVDYLKAEQQKQIIRITTLQHVKQEIKTLKTRLTAIKEQHQQTAILIQQEGTINESLEYLKKNFNILTEQKIALNIKK